MTPAEGAIYQSMCPCDPRRHLDIDRDEEHDNAPTRQVGRVFGGRRKQRST